MKQFSRPIEVITYSGADGELRPIRFRMDGAEGKQVVVPILKIISQEKERLAGNPMIKYRCQVKMDGQQKVIEIKYENDTCKWILYRA